MPRPILPRHRTHLDRLIDYIVGDGPSNRYALICRNCDSHNGMALKEEFEYFGKHLSHNLPKRVKYKDISKILNIQNICIFIL